LGGCLCGDLRYRVTGEPYWVGHCHCLMCQKASGAPFITGAMFARDAFEWTKGKPSYYQSSEIAKRGFCSRCSSPLTWENESELGVLAGCLDRSEDLEPTCHTWTSEMRPWIKLDDALPHYPGEEDSES
jgi:hypothetical protein